MIDADNLIDLLVGTRLRDAEIDIVRGLIKDLVAENERLRAALRQVDDDHGYGLPPDTRAMIRAALETQTAPQARIVPSGIHK